MATKGLVLYVVGASSLAIASVFFVTTNDTNNNNNADVYYSYINKYRPVVLPYGSSTKVWPVCLSC